MLPSLYDLNLGRLRAPVYYREDNAEARHNINRKDSGEGMGLS